MNSKLLNTEVSTQKTATPDELVAMGVKIWNRVRREKNLSDDQRDELLKTIQSEYADFSFSFPLVVKWAVQMNQFNERAFRKYLVISLPAKGICLTQLAITAPSDTGKT